MLHLIELLGKSDYHYCCLPADSVNVNINLLLFNLRDLDNCIETLLWKLHFIELLSEVFNKEVTVK